MAFFVAGIYHYYYFIYISELSTHQTMAEESIATIKVCRLRVHAKLPKYMTDNAAGLDLFSAEKLTIPAGGRAIIKTGISFRFPEGTYGRIAGRSGLTIKRGITIGAGVVDPDYEGDVGVVAFNLSNTEWSVKIGDRVAQLILEKFLKVNVVEINDDSKRTTRGKSGFGSTGD